MTNPHPASSNQPDSTREQSGRQRTIESDPRFWHLGDNSQSTAPSDQQLNNQQLRRDASSYFYGQPRTSELPATLHQHLVAADDPVSLSQAAYPRIDQQQRAALDQVQWQEYQQESQRKALEAQRRRQWEAQREAEWRARREAEQQNTRGGRGFND